MREKKTEHVSLRAPAFLRAAAEKAAREDGRTVSSVLCGWAVRGFADLVMERELGDPAEALWLEAVARLPRVEK